jgi:hypothetical protein
LLREGYRPVLVDVDVVTCQLGLSLRSVLAMVDTGELRWVWDVSLARGDGRGAARRRELRFWLGEVLAPAVQRGLSLDDAIRCVVGREAFGELRSRTVGEILRLRDQQMQHLMEAGELVGHVVRHSRMITRSSLVEFLRRRWVASLQPPMDTDNA